MSSEKYGQERENGAWEGKLGVVDDQGESYLRLVVSDFGRFVPLSDLLEETEISEKGPHASFDLVPERAEFLQ